VSETRLPAYTDRAWLIAMAAITAVQFGCWLALWSTGVARTALFSLYDIVAIVGLAVAFVIFFLWYLLAISREGEGKPFRRIAQDFDRSRLLAVIIATLLGPTTAGAFSSLKAAIPLAVPFYLDAPIAGFEKSFFGTDAWRISHALLGWATPFIDGFYLSWLPVMLLAFNLVLLSRPSPLKTRSMIAYLLMWPAVGTLGGYLLSSAGPIFHDALFGGNSGLLDALRREGANDTLMAYNHLWTAYANRFETLGGGISAMPSMHVAMAFWLAMTVRTFFPKFQWAGWIYWALIWVSSIHLGWHYASDGLVGSLSAALVWRVGGAVARLKTPWFPRRAEAHAPAADSC
jgi:PAP2 superfamily protein